MLNSRVDLLFILYTVVQLSRRLTLVWSRASEQQQINTGMSTHIRDKLLTPCKISLTKGIILRLQDGSI